MADRGLTADIGGSKARIVCYRQTGKKEVFEISGSLLMFFPKKRLQRSARYLTSAQTKETYKEDPL